MSVRSSLGGLTQSHVPAWLRACVLGACVSIAGCATPYEHASVRAREHGLAETTVDGSGFRHRIWYADDGDSGRPLHVYVEHDGVPWRARYFVASDPTPRQPVMLELAAMDPGPRLYLGRPCYFLEAPQAACIPEMWTARRYSEAVVASMTSALARFRASHPHRGVVLMGHSGGGTIVALMAERVPDVRAVITLAGNLDVARWTAYHLYSPLDGSLDPAKRPPLAADVQQWHYIGTRDGNVLPEFVRAFAAARPGAHYTELEGFDHGCCWRRVWPTILRQLDEQGL